MVTAPARLRPPSAGGADRDMTMAKRLQPIRSSRTAAAMTMVPILLLKSRKSRSVLAMTGSALIDMAVPAKSA